MLALALMLTIPVIVLIVLYITVPGSRRFIAGVATAVILGAAALLTGLADWIGGLG